MESLKAHLCEVLHTNDLTMHYFTKGQIGEIYLVKSSDTTYLLKTSNPSKRLQTEADMLKDIKKYEIMVPKVYDVSEKHLLMEYIEENRVDHTLKEVLAAKIISKLHTVTNNDRMYGYFYDTTIGPFYQKNEQTQYNWALFLGQMRILPMAQICFEKGKIGKDMMKRVELLCRDLYKRIDMTTITPSLLHGDIWSGNILYNDQGATLIDPAIYYGDKEMELAFILMFNTFGKTFFDYYTEVHPLSSDFYDLKVPLYQIYPTLVHVALYGASYTNSLETLLKRLKI